MTGPEASIALDPVVDADTRILLLGSLPGQVSLRERRYYAHPQNQFWRLIGTVIAIDLVALPYAKRLDSLRGAGIGLWDVIASAVRIGSLDSAIRDAQLRDLTSLIDRLPMLRAIGFNGAKAHQIGVRQLDGRTSLPLIALPSSSAAHAVGIAAKQDRWNELALFLDRN